MTTISKSQNNIHPWLKPLNLYNGMTLPHRIMPGPMEGIMKPLFCKTISELDLIDYWVTPFISVNTPSLKIKTLKQKLSFFLTESKPVIVQIMGKNPDFIVNTISKLKDIGITAVNLNFACPSKTVTSSKSGGWLLNTSDQMYSIIENILNKHNDISLSLKLRTGYYDFTEMRNFLPKLAEYNPDFIMLHFRTVLERYIPIANGPERIAKAVKLAGNIPIIASGNIFSVDDAENMFTESKCSGITVARGLFKNPFLIQEIKNNFQTDQAPPTKDYQQVFLQKMSELAQQEPSLYNRSSFIEIVKYFYGTQHHFFTDIRNLNASELLNYFI